ncbi:unnamed protein product [Psylliodes chrysocephalus]|uniref:Sodefrin-like factor n=1 Tax=Psylliodes chrysocephalus TaxID=3402493 RepID=A0A9P0GAZ1_9CUCU|nr:unnamed protein product [Psylliodes chrysocephala]
MASFITGVVAILLLATAANGLLCYNCNSKESVACNWGVTSFTHQTEECRSAEILDNFITPKCYKITGRNKLGTEYIARGCVPLGTVSCAALSKAVGWISYQRNGDPEVLQNLTCKTCETDKSNGLLCYNCNSKESVACNWGVTSFTHQTEECRSGEILDNFITPKCYKITGRNKLGTEYIARGCVPLGTVSCAALSKAVGWISYQRNGDPEVLQNLTCKTCETDKCNWAT